MEWEHREDLISDAWAPLVMISFRQMKAYFGRHEISCPTSSEWRSQNANKGLAHVRMGGGLLGGGSVRDKSCCCGMFVSFMGTPVTDGQKEFNFCLCISLFVSFSLYIFLSVFVCV